MTVRVHSNRAVFFFAGFLCGLATLREVFFAEN
jgi:hypothetical protein